MKIPLIAMLLIVALGASAQTSRTFQVKNFTRVAVRSGIDLYITQGNTESLQIKASEESMDDLQVDNSSGELTIRFKDGFRWGSVIRRQPVKAYLTVKNITALAASGGSDVISNGFLTATSLTVKASGGSDIELALTVKNLTVEASGGSDAELRGTAENFSGSASGGSDIKALPLAIQNARISVSGGSDAELSVARGLNASASGGGDIRYRGNPEVRKSSGSSSAIQRIR